MAISFHLATENEIEVISDLIYRSKKHWGYTEESLEKWYPFFYEVKKHIRNSNMEYMKSGTDIAGVYGLTYHKSRVAILEHFWINHTLIGGGYGNTMFQRVIEVAREHNSDCIEFHADIHAVGFYEKMGCIREGTTFHEVIKTELPFFRYKL